MNEETLFRLVGLNEDLSLYEESPSSISKLYPISQFLNPVASVLFNEWFLQEAVFIR
jgi:hypothetical protein